MYSLTIRNYNLAGIDPKKSSFTRYQSIHVTFFVTRMATGMLSQESVIVPSFLLRKVSKDLFQSPVKQELSS